ncbi:MAG TPA: hypothetical protein VFU40_07765, partial [Gemmatimonadales bacterium]|nr:hypothetical protein [Gemmatimonadales bacterium]
PILGPLTNGDGLLFEYLDAAGNLTGVADQVKSVRVTLKGLSDGPIVTGATSRTRYVRDSLVTQVVLRNALR